MLRNSGNMKQFEETIQIKQEPDYLDETEIMTKTHDPSVRVKEEQHYQTDNIKNEITREDEEEEEGYKSHVEQTQAVNYICLTSSLEEGCLYCEECQQKYEGDCPHHGPLIYLDIAETKDDHGYIEEFISQAQVDVSKDRQKIPGQEKVGKPGLCKEDEDVFAEEKMASITEIMYKKDGSCAAVLRNDTNTNSRINGNVSGDSSVCLESTSDVCETQNLYVAPEEMTCITEMMYKKDGTCDAVLTTDNNTESKRTGNVSFCLKSITDVCETKNAYKVELQDIETASVNEKSFNLGSDNGSYRLVNDLHIVKVHAGEKTYKCNICSLDYIDTASLTRHTKIHKYVKPHKCDDCGVGFKHRNDLKTHKRIHTGEKPYMCDVCGIGFAQYGSLKRHKIKHTGERPYKCDVCGAGFVWHGILKKHKRKHTGEKPYKCDVCGVGFPRHDSLNMHKRKHTGEKPYKCDICDARFPRHDYLKTHKIKHTEEKPYKCDDCGKRFTQLGNLRKHILKHAGEVPYKCEVCGLAFTKYNYLKEHNRKHNEKNHYKCDVCGVEFRHHCSLKTHERKHTGDQTFMCDVCGVRLIRLIDLKTHKRKHTGERPYKCEMCGLGFSRYSNMKTHKNTHTGERPYKCDICGVGFGQNGRLKTHRRIHSGENLEV